MNDNFVTNKYGKMKILADIKNVALLERMYDSPTKYIVAIGFDKEQVSWDWGKYYDKLTNAMNEFISITFNKLQEKSPEEKVMEKLDKSLYFLENTLQDEDMSEGFEEFLKNVIGLNKDEIALYNEYANEIELHYPNYKEFIKAELKDRIKDSKENLAELENQFIEVDNHYERIDIKSQYLKNEKEMKYLSEMFSQNTLQDKNLLDHFREDKPKDRFSRISIAGTILAGIDLRNLQRENNNLSGEKEEYPYTKEQIKMIDRYMELENEQERLENQFEETDEEEI